MNVYHRFFACLGFALASTHAQAVEISFTSAAAIPQAKGNTYTATDTLTGLTTTASAWSSATKGKFAKATLTLTQGSGLGACRKDEGVDCTGSAFADALGNNGFSDVIVFSFSGAVTLQSLTLLQVGDDSDLSLWAGTGTFGAATKLGPASLAEHIGMADEVKSVNLAAPIFAGTYNWLAVAARIGEYDDFAKLQSLTVEPVAQPVPEAKTWTMLLAGMALVGFAVRRRTRT